MTDELVLINDKTQTRKKVELVGLKKVENELRELEKLTTISVDSAYISIINLDLEKCCPSKLLNLCLD